MSEIDQASENKKAVDELANYQVKILTASYDKQKAYTNLIIIAGYAGFFGLWQITKLYLSINQAIWAALFMLASVTIFVIWEVIRAFLLSRRLNIRAKAIFNSELLKTPKDFTNAFIQYEKEERNLSIYLDRFWLLTWIPTVGFGIIAIAVLAWAFVSRLLSVNC